MRDPAPLSQRFDLGYVRRTWWPRRAAWWLSILLCVAAAVAVAGMFTGQDHRAFTSGDISRSHQFIAHDCAACHQPDPQHSGYWLPASDASCIACHQVAAHPDPHGHLYPAQPVGDAAAPGPILVSSGCADCHVEHLGPNHALARVSDAHCTQCHADLDRYSQPSSATPTTLSHAAGWPRLDAVMRAGKEGR